MTTEAPQVPIQVAIIDADVPAGPVYDCFRFSTTAEHETQENIHGQMVLSVALGLSPESGSACPAWSGSVDFTIYPVGEYGTPAIKEVARAITAATSEGANIINVSIALPETSADLAASIESARSAGSLVVAAGGNTSGLPALFPAAYESVLSVGSCSPDGTPSIFSATRDIDLYALGESVPVVLADGSAKSFSGTSAAAASVTHQAILLASASATGLTAAAAYRISSRLRRPPSLPFTYLKGFHRETNRCNFCRGRACRYPPDGISCYG